MTPKEIQDMYEFAKAVKAMVDSPQNKEYFKRLDEKNKKTNE